MNGRELLDQLYGQVRCANCGHRYRGTEVRKEERKGNALFLYLVCARCNLHALMIAQEAVLSPDPKAQERSPIDADDVLDAHEELANVARLPSDIAGKRVSQ